MAYPKSPSKCTHAFISTSKYISININDGSAQWLLPIDGILAQTMVRVESVGFRCTDLGVELCTNHDGGIKSANRISISHHPTIIWNYCIVVYPTVVAYRRRGRSWPWKKRPSWCACKLQRGSEGTNGAKKQKGLITYHLS